MLPFLIVGFLNFSNGLSAKAVNDDRWLQASTLLYAKNI